MTPSLPLQEHEAPAKEAASVEYDPTPEERKLVKRIDGLFDRYRAHRNNYDGGWVDDYKFFRGRQWKEQRPSYRHSEVLNLVFQVIQSQVPILTDSRPKFDFMPQEPGDREFADILNEIAQADWETKNWLYRLTEAIYDAHIYGTGLASLCFDKDARKGAGDIDFHSEELFYAYPDPNAEDVNVKGRGYIRAEPMTLAEVRRRWPEKGKFVKADHQDLLDQEKNVLEPLRFRNANGDRSIVETRHYGRRESQPDKVMVVECYYFDDEFSEEEKREVGEDGLERVTYEQRLKFPHGRRTVKAGNVILEDGPNPYADGLFPFLRLVNYMLPREFWGESEIAQIRGPQKIVNKVFSFILDVLTLTGNPIWVVDSNSGIDADLLTNAPGLIVEKNPGSEVRRESGTQLQPFVIQIFDRVREMLDGISGAQDITRGLPPGGVTAASAIADLQNAAQTRLRQKSRNIDAFLQQMGQMYVSRVMQFYTAPRVFRYTAQDGAKKYFRAYIADVAAEDGTQRKAIRVQRFDEEGRPAPEINEYQLRGEIDVRVTTGTALPFNKSQLKQEMLNLYDRQMIDREEYFKRTDYPNWEAVADRLAQREQAAAQAAQQGQPQA